MSEEEIKFHMRAISFAIIAIMAIFMVYVLTITTYFKQDFILQSRRARVFCQQQGSMGGFINYNWYPTENVTVRCYMPDNIYTLEEMWWK